MACCSTNFENYNEPHQLRSIPMHGMVDVIDGSSPRPRQQHLMRKAKESILRFFSDHFIQMSISHNQYTAPFYVSFQHLALS